MESAAIQILTNLDSVFDVLTFLTTIIAVFVWISFFRRIYISGKGDDGWLWIFSAVLLVLLLNSSVIGLSWISGRVSLDGVNTLVMNPESLNFVISFSRMVMAFVLSVGTIKLFENMRRRGNVKFVFKAIESAAEDPSKEQAKYSLKPSKSYLVSEGIGGDSEGLGFDVFTDLVTHGVLGFCATRRYPPQIMDEKGISKTPVVGLSQNKEYDKCVHPADLTELSIMIKEFINKGENTAVLLDGLEYLILHNSFEDILKVIQGLDDVVVRNNSRLIVTVDPSALSDQQYHLLARELKPFSGGG
jgi:hypothetical protein